MENLKPLLASGDLEVKRNSSTSDWENQYPRKTKNRKKRNKIRKKEKTNEVQQQQQPPISMILASVKSWVPLPWLLNEFTTLHPLVWHISKTEKLTEEESFLIEKGTRFWDLYFLNLLSGIYTLFGLRWEFVVREGSRFEKIRK